MNQCPDFTIRDEGTIVLFSADTPEAEDWWSENCEEGITFAGQFVVDHRYAFNIAEGIQEAGLTVSYQ